MVGLVDTYISVNSRDIGECIYCGERDGPLSNEHAVPFGLNGPWTLLRASCGECSKITTRFERDVMRCLWPDVRNVLAMQSRRRDKRSATIPLEVHHDGVRETMQVPRTQFPTYLMPLFPAPTILGVDTPIANGSVELLAMHLCGPTFEEASNRYPGCHFVGKHINFSIRAFLQLLAKIGFCAAVAAVGLAAFTNTPIRKVILGTDTDITRCVGSWWEEPVNTTSSGLHQIRVTLSQPGACIHAIIRLFAQFGALEYHIILGPADPTFIASKDWPAQ